MRSMVTKGAQVMAAALLLAGGAQHAAAQPETDAGPPAAPAAEVVKRPVAQIFAARLEALRPSEPEAYYLLAEEVADAGQDAAAVQLATELCVLALYLDLQQPGRHIIGSAACMQLGDLVHSERDRRWLVFLARSLDARRVPAAWLAQQPPETVESAGYQITTALGEVRSGDGVLARQLLDKPEVRTGLESYETLLSHLGGGSLASILREAQRWPCRECGNERVVKRMGSASGGGATVNGGSAPEYRVCPICNGDPGPDLSEREFLGQLWFEAVLLQGRQRSWAAQVASDGGSPLRDTDPSTVALFFGVDTGKVLWRKGEWVGDPSAKPPVPAAHPPGDPAERKPPAPTAGSSGKSTSSS